MVHPYLEGEGVVLARLALHVVLLGEDGVGEKVVGVEVEVEGEGLQREEMYFVLAKLDQGVSLNLKMCFLSV